MYINTVEECKKVLQDPMFGYMHHGRHNGWPMPADPFYVYFKTPNMDGPARGYKWSYTADGLAMHRAARELNLPI